MEREVDNQVAAPAETRTPNLHRANNRSSKSADGRVATAATRQAKTLSNEKKKQNHLTQTAYLGLKAGMTIAATYPAAVISMALLRLMKGSLLEENIARTVGSIGESVAAGAIFTIPAFVMAGIWPGLNRDQYWKSVALMLIGGTLGILFVTLLRRVMVEDPDLPFPESVAASEIHKAGQQGARAAKILFANMGFGAF